MRISDWSSDVCSSDFLLRAAGHPARRQADRQRPSRHPHRQAAPALPGLHAVAAAVGMTQPRAPQPAPPLPAHPLPAPRAILFDWDNTLVATWAVIHHALPAPLTALGPRPWPPAEPRRTFRTPARHPSPP